MIRPAFIGTVVCAFLIRLTTVVKKFGVSIFFAYANMAQAGTLPPFDDAGARYNPLEYIRTIDTGGGSYTLEFKNDEESYFTNFIVTSKGVVAFDPLSDSAALVYGDIIKKLAPNKPLLAIVYSHLHSDHIAGARVLRRHFGPKVPIIAHQRTLEFFQNNNTPYIDLPTDVVTDKGRVYQFGNRTVDLRFLGNAHTASMLTAVIPELRLTYICDFANNDVVGWTDLPGIDIDEMLKVQRRALDLKVDKVTFCHGPPGDLQAVKRQIDYFEALRAAARQALKNKLTEDQAAASIDLPQYRYFEHYSAWFKDNARAMYRWEKTKRQQ